MVITLGSHDFGTLPRFIKISGKIKGVASHSISIEGCKKIRENQGTFS